ncbi:hypothetical protein PR202_ga13564 [Eleusine coracana subsp. coracana]|uniref:Uncharacterized protein n=1 Tax=Eleusine coracana subsp. coracana TaxID=191504 RepID=A0AAV5CF09_ELECO|nr:hypothetical protein PR202_ga13564 [Eleusine coracana subsp. coracana]
MALQLLLPPALAAARPSKFLSSPNAPTAGAGGTAWCSRARAGVAFSLQTNVRLIKPSRRFRRSRDPYYDFDEDDDDEEDYGFEEEEEEENEGDDDLSGLEYPGVLYSNGTSAPSKRLGLQSPLLKESWEGKQPKTQDKYGFLEKSNSRSKAGRPLSGLADMGSEVKASAEERLEFLLEAGVKTKDMKRILVRQPQILEYTLGNLKSHVDFLCRAISEANCKVSD